YLFNQKGDPAADPVLYNAFTAPQMPDTPGLPGPVGTAIPTVGAPNSSSGTLRAVIKAASADTQGEIHAVWNANTTVTLQAATPFAATAVVADSTAPTRATGTVSLANALAMTISGDDHFQVGGSGRLSFYGPAESNLGVSGAWEDYVATVTGNVSITLT